MPHFLILASLTLAALLAGCAPGQFYASGQDWQRNECNKLLDSQERGRCLKNAGTSYPSCAKSLVLQGGDAERGHRRCPLALSIIQTDD